MKSTDSSSTLIFYYVSICRFDGRDPGHHILDTLEQCILVLAQHVDQPQQQGQHNSQQEAKENIPTSYH